LPREPDAANIAWRLVAAKDRFNVVPVRIENEDGITAWSPQPWRTIVSFNASLADNIATARALLNVAPPAADPQEPPGYRHRRAAHPALSLPPLWRSHDRHRGVRARL
jgi:hypothetical protein